MNLQEAKQKFFKANPNALAHFCFNDKLNKYLCYTFDYVGDDQDVAISPDLKEKIYNFSKGKAEDPIFLAIDYFSNAGINQDLLNKLSDFYYDCVVNEAKFKDTNAVCDTFNKFVKQKESKKVNKSKKSTVCCYLVNPDGSLDENRLFYMDLSFSKSKSGTNYCKIENTFTEDGYKSNGIHSYGIRFLESVLAYKNIYTLIGESQECDVYDSENGKTLEQHYEKLGFRVITDNSGVNHIVKEIDSNYTLEISSNYFELEK